MVRVIPEIQTADTGKSQRCSGFSGWRGAFQEVFLTPRPIYDGDVNDPDVQKAGQAHGHVVTYRQKHDATRTDGGAGKCRSEHVTKGGCRSWLLMNRCDLLSEETNLFNLN